ncbi:hypothetical protein [Leucobacter chromiireducens]|uniref:hypothetical protein n=1 Tax=Leucobacter chromiireducens TaxID=283877 RepID=UPI003F810B66
MKVGGYDHVAGVHRLAAVAEILLATGVTIEQACEGMQISREELGHLMEVMVQDRALVLAARTQITGIKDQQEDTQ